MTTTSVACTHCLKAGTASDTRANAEENWADAVAGYAARQGVATDVYTKGLQPVLTPDQVAAAVVAVAGDPGSAPEYLVSGTGYRALG